MQRLALALALALAGAGALLVPGPAHADQCAWLDPATADRAGALLARATQVLHYCEPCGDPAPGAPRTVGTVTVDRVSAEHRQLRLDDRDIDLAYTYVLAPGARAYRNLAALAGCPAEGVSPSLRVEAATAAGVLIVADAEPRREPPVEPARAAGELDPAATPVPPQPLVVVNTAPSPYHALLQLLLAATLLVHALLLLAIARRHWVSSLSLPRAIAWTTPAQPEGEHACAPRPHVSP